MNANVEVVKLIVNDVVTTSSCDDDCMCDFEGMSF